MRSKFSICSFLTLFFILFFKLFLGNVYRRLRKSPYLTDYNKLIRLLWCLKHRNTDFSKYIFIDETTIRLWDLPLYHWRLPTSTPDTIPCTSKYRDKVNICGGISFKGATNFKLHKLLNIILFKLSLHYLIIF